MQFFFLYFQFCLLLGINEPRASYDGGPLPGAREVSQRVYLDTDQPSKITTVAFTIWSQFLAYDLALTGMSVGRLISPLFILIIRLPY